MPEEKMRCPRCGGEMNRHAEKIDYSSTPRGETNKVFGANVQEVHLCPACGTTATRPAK